MKKILVSVAALAFIASCSKNEISEPIGAKQNPIGFSTLNSNSTRVANEGKSNYTVYAQYSDASVMTTFPGAWYIEDYELTSADAAINEKGYYWPDESLDFYAFAPSSVVETAVDPELANPNNKGKLSIDYTVPTGAGEDFTVATPVIKTHSGDDDNGVALTFNHMLSKLQISAELVSAIKDAYTLVPATVGTPITVEFTTVYNKGKVDITLATPLLTDIGTNTDPNLTYSKETTVVPTNNKTARVSYYIMPHADTNEGCTVTIKGLAIKHNKIGIPKPLTLTHTFIRHTEDDKKPLSFQANTLYDIVFSVKAGEIVFSSSVADWADPSLTVPL